MTFPRDPLDLRTELQLTSGTWTDASTYPMQREGTSPPVVLTRGRQDESTQATASTATFELNNRDGRFSPGNAAGPYYGRLGRNTPARFSVPARYTRLRTEDDTASGASCPDASPLRISSGTLDVRLDLNLTDWQGANFVSNMGAAGSYSWSLRMLASGTLQGLLAFEWSPDGTVLAEAACPVQPPAGRRLTLRVTYAVSTGVVTFWYGPPGGAKGTAWTLLAALSVPGETGLAAGANGISLGAANGLPGFYGSVYELVVMSGSTVVADADFTAQAAGTTSFADAHGNTWTLGGTAAVDDRDYRGHFELSSLPGKWDVTGSDVSAAVQGGGLLRRIGQGQSPVQSAMKRGLLQQNGDLYPVAYWPCEDLQGSTSIGSAVGGEAMLTSGGTGDGSVTTSGPAYASDDTFNCSNSLPTLNGSSWYGRIPAYTSSGSIIVRFLLHLGAVPAGGPWAVARVITTGTCQQVALYATADNVMELVGYNANGGTVFNSTAFTMSNLPNPVWCSIELQPGFTGVVNYGVVTLVPGQQTGQEFGGTYSGTIGKAQQVNISPSGQWTDTVAGQISVQSAWESMFNLQGPVSAWQGETAASRFGRLCGENGLASRIIGAPVSSAVMGPQAVDTLSNLLQACEDADRGQVFEPRQQLALGYRTLASMCGQPVRAAADYAASHPGGTQGSGDSELEPTYDDQYLRNDETLTRASGNVSGSSYQYQLNDGSMMSISPPPAGVGDYSDSLSVAVAYDGQLPDIAQWMVHIGTVNEARWPSIPFNLARRVLAGTDLYWDLLDCDVGDLVTVDRMLAQVTADTVRQLAWQLTESLGGFHHTLVLTGVPASPYDTGTVGTGTAGDAAETRADTDGSTLAAAAAAGSAPSRWGGPSGWPGWAGTSAAVATAADGSLTVTADGTGTTFWQAYGPSGAVAAGQKVAVVATVTAPEALAAVAVGIHLGGGSDTYTASTAAAVAPGETVTLCVTATAAAGQTTWTPYVVDSEDSASGTVMSIEAVYGGVAGSLSAATGSGDAIWTTAAADMPFDIGAAGERITVCAVSGSSSPQTMTVLRAVNGIVKAQPEGTAVALFRPSYVAIGTSQPTYTAA